MGMSSPPCPSIEDIETIDGDTDTDADADSDEEHTLRLKDWLAAKPTKKKTKKATQDKEIKTKKHNSSPIITNHDEQEDVMDCDE
ncbi:uncharacterized protein RCC_09469 [Ramularia collo-cygni]|uniref:Uncharacterized protein n=1 Tax=Ramularia collo-cygni TaxID=112498 RepID=A0A2D3VDC1_9PEZI|nr:uncharacterized protein RCC_09469 [Ramularia collo-cygni]CZT23755.1 uncharacterized protein RCC_09469 [Ramularia collo-cygni]